MPIGEGGDVWKKERKGGEGAQSGLNNRGVKRDEYRAGDIG